MRAVVIIPARYASSRFPGKPLAMIAGVSLIERVWRQSVQALPADDVHVATDDDRIADHVRGFGGQVVMTSSEHETGTDRVHEAAEYLGADCVVNVQGDEPLVDPRAIEAVLRTWHEQGGVVNAMAPIADEDEHASLTVPKVVASPRGDLLYMSRAAIPGSKSGPAVSSAMKQVCIYAFDRESLAAFADARGKTPLESTEDIEILRFLELGRSVRMVDVESNSIAVDVPVDVVRVERYLTAHGMA